MKENQLTALREIAHPLRTPVADANTEDLLPLKEILQGVRILGLGESTHGTREIFQLKHRLTRFLVEEMGYRAFAIEAGGQSCRNIDDYVMMGKGDKYRALSSQGYWTWDTVEVMDMIDWMRSHNLACPRGQECRFLGYDMKPIEGACDALWEYLNPVAGEAGPRLREIILRCRGTVWMSKNHGTEGFDLYWMMGWLRANETELRDKTCARSYALALENCRYLFQYMDCMAAYTGDPNAGKGERDFYMAENISYLLERELLPNAKIVVWAHNGHIAVDPAWKNQGWHLRQKYGSQYYAMSIGFGKGGFQSRLMPMEGDFESPPGAMPLQGFVLEQPVDGSWDADLDAAFHQSAYVDFRRQAMQSPALRQWLGQRKPVFSVGSGYNPDLPADKYQESFCQDIVLNDSFDGTMFLKTAQRARPNPNGMR